MSTHALRTSEPPAGLRALRYADLGVLALALPVFVLADLPLLGYAIAAAAWLVQRAIQVLTTRRAAAATDPRTIVGITAASMIGRGWLMALAIFGTWLATRDDDAGLAAAVLVLALFTVYFTGQAILRPFESTPGRAPGATPAADPAAGGMTGTPSGKENPR